MYSSEKRHDRAIQLLDQAIARNPKQPKLHETLAQVHLSRNDLTRAEEEYKKAAAIDPKNSEHRVALAGFYVNTGQQDKSIATLQAILKDDPSNADVRLQLAEVFLNRKEFDRASAAVDEVLKANAKNADALVMRGRVLMAGKKTGEAIGVLQNAVAADPSSQAARYFSDWPVSNRETGSVPTRMDRAATREGASHRSTLPWETEAGNGDPDAAIRYAQQALNINQRMVDSRLVIGAAYGNKRITPAPQPNWRHM